MIQPFSISGTRACPGLFIGGKIEVLKAKSGGGVLGDRAVTPFPSARGLGGSAECSPSSTRGGASPDRPKLSHYILQHSGWPLLTLYIVNYIHTYN